MPDLATLCDYVTTRLSAAASKTFPPLQLVIVYHSPAIDQEGAHAGYAPSIHQWPG